MSDYDLLELGAPDQWYDYFGGFTPDRSRDGRRVVDHDIDTQYIGMTANAYEPGEEAGYWHTHAQIEELYVFIAGTGQMGLDDEVVDVRAGSVVRVGQGVWRTWRAMPDSPGQLRWLCIRAGGGQIAHMPDDAERDVERPAPW
ncbi:cupin domain-containing protein [Microbacterium thalassium]|uniref:Mannose-6-phosphate isomerase-like protein (Cupin superfamily) n=1 Tax=Microbacterium thalassium TaxID=362649 RepID=A0A7X0FS38_9MICO|nr:cupin domain-containing protein [Microbacterium thalassium]MBB6392697.1 mannose-6-phosphate isomerase-like protein (cupin superfamily) [Microbacterium thalassium]